MKKWYAQLLLMVVMITGCSQEEFVQVEDLTGYVSTISGDGETQSMTVYEIVDVIKSTNPKANSYTVTDDTEILNSSDKVRTFDDIKRGSKVKMWNNGIVAESYPGQTVATKIVIYEDEESMIWQRLIDSAYNGIQKEGTWFVSRIEKKDDHHWDLHFRNLQGESISVSTIID